MYVVKEKTIFYVKLAILARIRLAYEKYAGMENGNKALQAGGRG